MPYRTRRAPAPPGPLEQSVTVQGERVAWLREIVAAQGLAIKQQQADHTTLFRKIVESDRRVNAIVKGWREREAAARGDLPAP